MNGGMESSVIGRGYTGLCGSLTSTLYAGEESGYAEGWKRPVPAKVCPVQENAWTMRLWNSWRGGVK